MERIAAAVLIALSGASLAQEPPKPLAQPTEPAKPAANVEAEKPAGQQPVIEIEKSTRPPDCVIKPVMTDEELRACGARVPENRAK
jgi:hypothetical protein